MRAEPYWRFLDTEFDFRRNDRSTPARRAAHDTVRRARELCARGTFAGGLQVQAGDAVFFRSLKADGSIDSRALHGSCPNTGDKWVLSKFVRVAPLSETVRKGL